MTIKEIMEYVLHTPHNTNPAILIEMLKRLIIENGGIDPDSPNVPDIPDAPGIDIIYDGGLEK